MFSILTSAVPLDRNSKIAKTLGYYVSFIALGMCGAALGTTLPELAHNTGVNLDEIAFLFTVGSTGYLLGSLISGRLFDRFPGHPIFVVSLLVMAVVLVFIPIMTVLFLLAAIYFLFGFVESGIDVGGNTLIVWVHGKEVGPFMNLLHFCFGLGAFCTPIIMAQSRSLTDDITAGYWVLAIFMVVVAVGMQRLPSPAIRSEAADETFVSINIPFFLLIAVLFFLFVAMEMIYAGWIFTYATEMGIADKEAAAYLNSLFWGTFTVGRLLSVPIAGRFRPRTILIANALGVLVSVALILIWSDPIMVWIGTAGVGISVAAAFPTLMSFTENFMSVTGKIAGGFLVTASLANMLIPPVIGHYFEKNGPETLMWFIFADALVTVILFGGLMISLRGNKAAE